MIFAISVSFGQTKDELIEGITQVNSLDGWDGIIQRNLPGEAKKINDDEKISPNNYYNFRKLKQMISKEELIKLTTHENQVLRLYAIRELIEQNNTSLDLKNIIVTEIKDSKYIQVHNGCIISQELSYSILYHSYWNQVRINSRKIGSGYEEIIEENIMQAAVENDELLREINTEIIKLDQDVYWLIYKRIFDSGKFNDNLKSDIVQLIKKFNNKYAYAYILKYYPQELEKD
jgi:hypothetical protein